MKLKISIILLLSCFLLSACEKYEHEPEPLQAVVQYTDTTEAETQEFTIKDYEFIKVNNIKNSVLKVNNSEGRFFYLVMESELANTLYQYTDKIKLQCVETYPENWIEETIDYYGAVYGIDNKEEILNKMLDSGMSENNVIKLRDYSVIDLDGKNWGHLSVNELNTLFNS